MSAAFRNTRTILLQSSRREMEKTVCVSEREMNRCTVAYWSKDKDIDIHTNVAQSLKMQATRGMTFCGIGRKRRPIHCLIKLRLIGGVEAYLHAFLTSTLDGGKWSSSRSGRLTQGTLWTGGWVGPRTDLDWVAKRNNFIIAPIEKWTPTPVVQPIA
jgi:hypothetical protein